MRRFILSLAILLAATLPSFGQNREFAYPETWMQFTPYAFDLAAGELGLKAEHQLSERLVTAGIAVVSEAAICLTLKTLVDETRPDGSRNNSFPSAHTAAAFTGAELIRQEYGNEVGCIFYACGIYVAAMRVQHQRHWWWDTVAGAGIGVASAWIGKALSEPAWTLLESLGIERGGVSFAPTYDPFSGSVGATFALVF